MKGLRTVVIGLGCGLALVGCAKKPVPPPPPPTVEQHVEKVPGGVQVTVAVSTESARGSVWVKKKWPPNPPPSWW